MGHSTNTNSEASRRYLRPSIPVAAIACGWLTVAAAQDVPDGTLAAAIRASGNPCQRVIEKERVSESASTWRVRCNSGEFQVTMENDSTPKVVPLD